MSLQTSIGAIGNLLDERPEYCRRVVHPIARADRSSSWSGCETSSLRGFRAVTLSARIRSTEGADGLERAVDSLCRGGLASGVGRLGHRHPVRPRGGRADRAPLPALLATAAVHSHLVREGARTMCGLVVDSGEPRETMHVALLLGYGAAAVCPYLVLDALEPHLRGRYVEAVDRRPAQGLFEDGHLDHPELPRCTDLRGSRAGVGADRPLLPGHGVACRRDRPGRAARAAAARHAAGFGDALAELDRGGEYRLRRRGEHHRWDERAIVSLQRAVRDHESRPVRGVRRRGRPAGRRHHPARAARAGAGGEPLPLDQVEP